MKTVDILIAARKKLVKYGWVQGHYGCEDDGFCALGAIFNASGDNASYTENTAKKYLEAVVGGSIPNYNDNPHRTKADVLAAYDKAIKNARRRHISG